MPPSQKSVDRPKRGVRAGATVKLRIGRDQWRDWIKPSVLRGINRRPQLLIIVRGLILADVPVSVGNVRRLGFGRTKHTRDQLAWCRDQLLLQPGVTEKEKGWIV